MSMYIHMLFPYICTYVYKHEIERGREKEERGET